MRARGNIKEDHFIRALIVIAHRQLDRIADIAQPALLGLAELDAARHLPIMHIQARYDSFSQHSFPKKGTGSYTFGALDLQVKGRVRCPQRVAYRCVLRTQSPENLNTPFVASTRD